MYKLYLATRYMTERISSPNPRCFPLPFPFLDFFGGSLKALNNKMHHTNATISQPVNLFFNQKLQYPLFTLSIRTDGTEQTVKTQIRCRRMRHLIRIYTICYSSTNTDILLGSKSGFI